MYTSEHSLFQLARKGKVEEMKRLCAKHLAPPNDISLRGEKTAFEAGWTILHVLALCGTINIMNRVMPHLKGVDLLWRDSKGRTAADAL